MQTLFKLEERDETYFHETILTSLLYVRKPLNLFYNFCYDN